MHLLEQYSNRQVSLETPFDLRKRLKQRSDRQMAANEERTERMQKQHRLTPDEVSRLVAEYKGGDSIRTIATRWSMCKKTISAQLKKAGVVIRRT